MNTPQSSLLDATLAVVQETERRVLTFRSAGAIPDAIMRHIVFPFPFLQRGIGELFRPASKWAFLSFLLLVAAVLLIPNAGVSAEAKSYIYMVCAYAPLFFVVFAVPSTFAFDSIRAPQIQSLADYIYGLGIDSKEKIEAIEENLANIAERTSVRMKALKWLVATIWALFLYSLNQINNIALKIAPERVTKVISDNISAFAMFSVVTILSVLVIVGYRKGNDAVFRRLQFALQELKFRLASFQAAAQPIIPPNLVQEAAQASEFKR